MKRVGGRQTRYVNKLEKRSGTLWEGRYKSCPVSRNYYMQACIRYIEMNPVRAGVVADPGDYRWSSFGAKVKAANTGTDRRSAQKVTLERQAFDANMWINNGMTNVCGSLCLM